MSRSEDLSPAELAGELRRHLALYRSVGVDLMPPLPPPIEDAPGLATHGDGRAQLGREPAERAAHRAALPKLASRQGAQRSSEAGPHPAPAPPAGSCAARLMELQARIGPACDRCSLARQGRSKVVFGVGNPEARVMFIGEAPGRDEDRLGEPFVGAAGHLLTKIIEGGMGLRRPDVYIANVIKCRPPNNRDPAPLEVATCRPFVLEQISIIKPRVVVTLGRIAAQALLGVRTSITRMRGSWQEICGIPVMPTFHPAYLLRNPSGKRPVWEDIQAVMKKLSEEDGQG